jgi:hypothetical protein
MRVNSTLYYILGDHDLAAQDSGSTSVVTTNAGARSAEVCDGV